MAAYQCLNCGAIEGPEDGDCCASPDLFCINDMPDEIRRLRAQLEQRTDIVPGVMHCAKCAFQLIRVTLAVNLGQAVAGDSKTEPCPNGCGPLWPVTWQQYARQMEEVAEAMAERVSEAEKPRVPLSRDAIRQGWRDCPVAGFSAELAFRDGVRFAERKHDIGE